MPEQKPLKKPVDWDDLYPGRFLKAGQLGDKKVTVTIREVGLDRLMGEDGSEKTKGVLSFVETEMQIPINRTNGICLREMFGRDVTQWPGHKVTLFKGEWKGEPAVRIWGSPELPADRQIEIQLPRRRPIKWTLHAMRPANQEGGATRAGNTGSSPA